VHAGDAGDVTDHRLCPGVDNGHGAVPQVGDVEAVVLLIEALVVEPCGAAEEGEVHHQAQAAD
jgi:hypothetical protein